MAVQKEQAAEIFAALVEENTMRRQMLIERSRVTLQSLLWSERLKEQGTVEQARSLVEGCSFEARPAVTLDQIYAARLGTVSGSGTTTCTPLSSSALASLVAHPALLSSPQQHWSSEATYTRLQAMWRQ